jgi:predicted phage terminase large subunit-like protein
MKRTAIRLDHQQIVRAALRQDFGTFVAKVFSTVSPGDEYLHNWHIDAVVHALLQVHRGENRRLIINQPPRSLKSICASVAFVAWSIGHDPSKKFACISYSHELAATFARQFRSVITSDWYRTIFPSVRFSKDSETECETTRGGGRFALPVGGTFTGRGADVIIIDDPLKADEAQSEKARRTLSDWYSTTLSSRLNKKRTGAIVLVMQRLHEDDLAGKLLREDGWHHLNLPAIAQQEEAIAIGLDVFHHRLKGDILHPTRESADVLNVIKREMGSLAFSAQYLQRPIPIEGNLIKRSWLVSYDELPNRTAGTIVQSWDVASSTSETRDWSVCTTWLNLKRQYFLIDVWRGRLEFPELRQKLAALAREQQPNQILVENAGVGMHLVQEFRANPIAGIPLPQGIKPEGDKLVRMEAQCARFENGQVHIPREASWLDELLHEILAFPKARYDDQIDSISQFLNWAEREHSGQMLIGCAPKIFIAGIEWHPSADDN